MQMSKEKLPASASVIIEYTNSKGECSSRQVEIKQFDADGSNFSAYCLQSRRPKTFKFSSVSEAVDAATGEVLPDLYEWLLARHQVYGVRDLQRFVEEYRCIVDVLVYMSHCDGESDIAERESIARWLLEQSQLGSHYLQSALNVIAQWPVPDLSDFDYSAGRAAMLFPELKEALLLQAAQVMVVDALIHQNEVDTLARLKRLLG